MPLPFLKFFVSVDEKNGCHTSNNQIALNIGTAIGALCAGLPAGIFVLKEYVAGACPGLLSALIFIAPDGSMGNFVLACVVAVIAIVVSFIAARVIIKKNPNYIE